MKNVQKGSTTSLIISVIVVIIIAVIVFASRTSAPATAPVAPADTNSPVVTTPSQPVVTTPSQPSKPVTTTPTPKPTPAPAPVSVVPIISSIAPLSGATGITVKLTGTGFLSTTNTVLFGGGPVINTAVTNNGTLLTFTVPSSVGADCKPAEPCPMYARLISPGNYGVSVRNANGTSNAVSFTVTGSGTTGFQPQ